jgi:hypothetical protein
MERRQYLIPCAVRERLAGELHQCHVKVMQLGERQAQAITDGNLEAVAGAEARLRTARLSRDAAHVALRDHTAEHGCL